MIFLEIIKFLATSMTYNFLFVLFAIVALLFTILITIRSIVVGRFSFPKSIAFIVLGLYVTFSLISSLLSPYIQGSLFGGLTVDTFYTSIIILSVSFITLVLSKNKKLNSIGTYKVLILLILYFTFILIPKINLVERKYQPSIFESFNIAKSYIDNEFSFKNIFTGVGSNRYFQVWSKYRGIETNLGNNFNLGTDSAFNIIFTKFITEGVLSALLLFIFILISVTNSVKLFIKDRNFGDILSAITSLISALIILFLPINSLLFVIVISSISLSLARNSTYVEINLRKFTGKLIILKKITFYLVSLTILVGSIFILYKTYLIENSIYFSNQAVINFSGGELMNGVENINKAVAYNVSDPIVRIQSNVLIDDFLKTMKSIDSNELNSEPNLSQINNKISTMINTAGRTVTIDGGNYLNWLNLADSYAVVAYSHGPESYFTEALKAYKIAKNLSPNNPLIDLKMASLYFSAKQNDNAKNSLKNAINLKHDYAEAYSMLSNILNSEGATDDAIASLKTASQLSPNDPIIKFRLGSLYFAKKDYQSSATELFKAVAINNSYSNAKYLLALDLIELKRNAEALTLLNILEKDNPTNMEIKKAIEKAQGVEAPVLKPKAGTVKK